MSDEMRVSQARKRSPSAIWVKHEGIQGNCSANDIVKPGRDPAEEKH